MLWGQKAKFFHCFGPFIPYLSCLGHRNRPVMPRSTGRHFMFDAIYKQPTARLGRRVGEENVVSNHNGQLPKAPPTRQVLLLRWMVMVSRFTAQLSLLKMFSGKGSQTGVQIPAPPLTSLVTLASYLNSLGLSFLICKLPGT